MNELMEFITELIKDFFSWVFDKDNTILDKFSNAMDKVSYFFTGGKK